MTLSLRNLNAYYGSVQVLWDVNFSLPGGEVLCLFGRNGAGKTTALKAIMGLVARNGDIYLDHHDLTALPAHRMPGFGIG